MDLAELDTINDKKLEKSCLKTIEELENFFEIKLDKFPEIIFVKTREEINKLKGRKTESWVVGWADSGKIYILDKDNFESESDHKYSDESYSALIKHELIHLFFSNLSKRRKKPYWLNEGVSIYVSGQLKFKKKPEKFGEFLDFGENTGKGVYRESGFFVELLVNKFGKEKLLELIRRLPEIKSEDGFKNLFKEIYGFDLNYEGVNGLW
jgi:hypothetical protein